MKIPAFLPIVAALVCANISPAQEPEKPIAEIRERMQKMKREMAELRANGHADEAKKMEDGMREEMSKHMAKHDGMGKMADMGNDGEKMERMQHVQEAIKHLRAAGLKEPAERIEQMGREMQQAAASGRDQAVPREALEQMQRALKETHEQMAKMARAIEELREQVGKRDKHD